MNAIRINEQCYEFFVPSGNCYVYRWILQSRNWSYQSKKYSRSKQNQCTIKLVIGMKNCLLSSISKLQLLSSSDCFMGINAIF